MKSETLILPNCCLHMQARYVIRAFAFGKEDECNMAKPMPTAWRQLS
jgi:hypothetical protein